MESNELRIGNWVLGYDDKEFQWGLFHFQILKDNSIDADEIAIGIQLTEEWLLKFGVLKLKVVGYVISGAIYWRKGNITFYQRDGKFYLPIGENLGDSPGHTVIQFDKVHELQNIFALTGEELTINK